MDVSSLSTLTCFLFLQFAALGHSRKLDKEPFPNFCFLTFMGRHMESPLVRLS